MDREYNKMITMYIPMGEFVILLATIAGLFFWSRSESREDTRRIEGIVDAIRQEIKDFHGRLCAIEGR